MFCVLSFLRLKTAILAIFFTVFSRHTKVQLRIHRAWIAEFFGLILGLPVKVLDGFQIKWYEMKGGTFNLLVRGLEPVRW